MKGGPLPTISWFHNETELTGDKLKGFEVMGDGTLNIKLVTNQHAGKYKCVATNSQGTAESEGFVDLVGEYIFCCFPK